VIWVAVGLLTFIPAWASAQQIAFDGADPNDPWYVDGWDEFDNGGFGFEPWQGGMYANPWEIDSGTPEPDNDLGAPAFRYGTGGFGYWAVRPFTAPMAAGQSFKMDFDQLPYSFPSDPVDPVPVGYFSNDSLLRFSSDAGERFSLYNWYAAYNDGTNPVTYFNSADEWGIGAATAFDNLNGGAALPTGGSGFMTGYTGPDSTDGFSMTLDIVTIDTYRLRIVDDDVVKVDVSGQLTGGATAGQGIDTLTLWSNDATGEDIGVSYFTNLEVLVTESEGLAGDFNEDGKVDAADYVRWRKNSANNPLPNDGGLATQAERYSLWRSNFGDMAGSGSVTGAVPEPTAIVLLLIGLAAAMPLRRAR
jgi:hypothetical protein